MWRRVSQVVMVIGMSICMAMACARPSPEAPEASSSDGAPAPGSPAGSDAAAVEEPGVSDGGVHDAAAREEPDVSASGEAEPSQEEGEPVAQPGEVVVEIVGLRNDDGQVLIALFRSSDGFPDDRDRAEASEAVPIRDGRARHVFSGVEPGRFAVAVLHDENENFKMDTNILGIPREGYGASRNPAPRLGPPRFDDAVLELQPGQRGRVRIQVVYP